ncbi:uncharacterized protein [Montipora capricornis]|uniref:uncharacterized protein isoform X3 n=1 Tax=Montipora capricornis TaxID=246305 RepID=UPI0035F1627A
MRSSHKTSGDLGRPFFIRSCVSSSRLSGSLKQASRKYDDVVEERSCPIEFPTELFDSFVECAAHQEPEDMSYESDGEEDENGDEVGDGEDSVSEKTDKKAKKAGRKAKWSQSLLDDTIDEPFTDFKNLGAWA